MVFINLGRMDGWIRPPDLNLINLIDYQLIR